MQLLIASDIFGRTAALEALAHQLGSSRATPLLVDPYGGLPQQFATEAAAYAHFQRDVGLDHYIEMLRSAVAGADPDRPLVLLGFSVGASAVWVLGCEPGLPSGTHAYCFYGSQIRHYPDLAPRIGFEIFFPRWEPHFEVADLMRRLSSQEGLVCHRTPYLHGFMNKLSANFDSAAYNHYLGLLKKRLAPG
jgi:dienelactone hydrolase